MDGTDRVRGYYDRNSESGRFDSPQGRLEYIRSRVILERHLGPAPLDILDAGGGTGAYSFWLAGLGHRVSFLDLSEGHVAAVRAKSRGQGPRLVRVAQGDAVDLPLEPACFDVVLSMGPMYHLPPGERLRALAEARRVLRPGGLLACAYISRFAALMDGYRRRLVLDPAYRPLAWGDVQRARHDAPDNDKYFTLAFMHRPDEIAPELQAAGFTVVEVCAVEGLFWTYPHLAEFMDEPALFEGLLADAALIEKEPSVMGASAHLLAIATAPGAG